MHPNAVALPSWLYMQHDEHREGSGATKNKAIRRAVSDGAEVVVVLDDDCFPAVGGAQSLHELADRHLAALEAQPVASRSRRSMPRSRR